MRHHVEGHEAPPHQQLGGLARVRERPSHAALRIVLPLRVEMRALLRQVRPGPARELAVDEKVEQAEGA